MTGTTQNGMAELARLVSGKQLRTVLGASMIGTTIEWYDFFLYGTAAQLVFSKLYFPSSDPLIGTLLAFATFAVGFVARPIGGLVFGHIGDRIGRKKTLVVTMMIMGLATSLMGALPTYADIGVAAPALLILLRIAQGIAIGGEWGGAVLLAVEYAGPSRRGLFGSVPQMGMALGLLLGTAAFTALNGVMDEQAFLTYGWRIAFLSSALLVLVGLLVRLKVMETPAFQAMRSTQSAASAPAAELFRNPLGRRHLLLGLGSRFAEGVAFNTWAVFILTYGTDRLGYTEGDMLVVVAASAALMLVTIPLAGRLSDVLGRRRVFAFGAAAFGVLACPVFGLFELDSFAALFFGVVFAFGICYPIMYGPQAALYCELFPTSVRYTGISLVYQFSGIFASGLTPLILTALLGGSDGFPGSMIAYLVIAGALSTACTLAVRQRDLSPTIPNIDSSFHAF
jgi:MFS family permease